MRICAFAAMLIGVTSGNLFAQETCLDSVSLIDLDSQWERAMLESDAERFRTLLADGFIWVHNHASAVDSKATILERAIDPAGGTAGTARSRVQSNVEARVLGSTAIVTGFTVVDRGSEATRYNFMRTYAEVDGRCVLLANHTMAIPEEGQ